MRAALHLQEPDPVQRRPLPRRLPLRGRDVLHPRVRQDVRPRHEPRVRERPEDLPTKNNGLSSERSTWSVCAAFLEKMVQVGRWCMHFSSPTFVSLKEQGPELQGERKNK